MILVINVAYVLNAVIINVGAVVIKIICVNVFLGMIVVFILIVTDIVIININ